MKKCLFILILIVNIIYANELYLLSKDSKRIGCITCNEYSTESIWNEYSTYGNKYSTESIWNEYSTYGNEYSTVSPWNDYGEGMKIVDLDGNYYGQFTINEYINQTSVHLLKSILDAYSKNNWNSLEEFRKWVAPQIN